jgi:hypothetical protein
MPGRARVVALGSLLVAAAATAVVLTAISASLTAEADTFYTRLDSSGLVLADDAVFRYYNDLQMTSSILTTLASPLLLVALAGTFLLLAVLWVRRDAPRPTQAEATAAS